MDEHSIRPSAEVAEALRAGRPVVALESTIVSHGLPRPDNLKIAACTAPRRRASTNPPT